MVNSNQGNDCQIGIGESVVGSAIVAGDGNTVAVHYSETKIIQMNRDEVKTRPLITTSPYKGLKTFAPEDKDLFFGRHQFVSDLVQQIEQANLILLLGASGSGKSSVIRAGVIPQLAQKHGARFSYLMFTPDHDPYESLYASLLRQCKQSEAQRAREAKAETLSQVVTTLKPPNDFWLIFIDQFEELFTISAEDKRKQFIDGLVKLSQKLSQTQSQLVKVVATMRADFLDRLSPYPAFVKITDGHRPLIAEMQKEELRSAIELPAAQHGVVFEDTSVNLVDEIIKDVQGQAGYLPLLQYTLNLLWEQEVKDGGIHDRTLNYDSYCNLGGVRGALQQHVDIIYQAFSASEQAAVKKIFLKIVEIGGNEASGTEWQPVRRRASKAEFTDATETKVLMRLIDENLLVSNTAQSSASATTQSVQSTIEIAHEILLTSWTTLNGWIKENREAIALRNRLNDDVALWQQKNKAESELWSGAKLEQALELRRNATFNQVLGGFSHPANQFIDASLGVRERQRRRTLVGLSSFSAFALLLSGFALYQLQQAQQKEVAQLVATANSLFSADSADAMLNAITANSLSQSFLLRFSNYSALDAANHVLLNAIQYIPERNRITLESSVYSVAFSPDGKTIATGNYDGTIRCWNTKTGQPVGNPLQAHTDGVTSVAFSPDGTTIVSGSYDGTVRFWNVETRMPIGSLQGHQNGVISVAFSPDGTMIVTGGADKIVRLWNAKTGQLINSLQGHENRVNSVAFSPDGTMIASGGDYLVRLWNAKTGQLINSLQGHENWVNSVAFSPNGTMIVSSSHDGTVRRWDAKTGQPIGDPLQGSTYWVYSVAFSPDSTMIVSGSYDGTVHRWDAKTGQPIGDPLQGHTVEISSVAFSPDGKTIATGSRDKTVRLWDVATEQPIGKPLREHTYGVNSVALSPNGKMIASGSWDETVRLWDVATEQPVGKLLGEHTYGVNSIAFSPDGKTIVTGNYDGTVRRWDITTGQPIDKPLQHASIVTSVAFSPNGKMIAAGSANGTVRRWDAQTGQPIGDPFQAVTNAVNSVVFSPDGKMIVSGNYDGTVRRWDAQTGQPIGDPLRGHANGVNSVAFSPDGKMIASGSADNTIRRWDAQTGQSIGEPLKEHTNWIYSVAFSPDGKVIASGGYDNSLRVWNAETGQPIGVPLWHLNPVTSVAFSPDSKMIVSGSQDNTVRLWPIFRENWLDTACKKLQYHSMLLTPKNDVAKTAKRTCEQSVYSTAAYKLEKGGELAKTGEIDQAIRLYQDADKKTDISGKQWNHLCWFGSLHRQAASVLFACDQAVSDDPANIWFYNSRGIARAVTGNTQGAIEDFSVFLSSPDLRPEQKRQQQQWVEALRTGENPFTDEVLGSLFLL